jgi:hypothetical protein
MLGGLSQMYIVRTPPAFWANAVPLPDIASSSTLAAAAALSLIDISQPP